MSSHVSPVRSARAPRHRLSAGVALIGCSLASTAALGGGSALNYTTVNSFSGTIAAGGTSFTYTLGGPSTGFFYSAPATGSGVGVALGNWSSGFDVIGILLNTNANYTSATGSGSISLTFSADVVFTDVGLASDGVSGGWIYNGSAVNDGDVFVASGGPYVFTINYAYSGASISQFISTGGFSLASSAVPLPGAAGLAACGLLGLGRRRRR